MDDRKDSESEKTFEFWETTDVLADLSASNDRLQQQIGSLQRAQQVLLRARDTLEQRLTERAAQLKQTNQILVQEIARRKKLEESVREGGGLYKDLVEHSPVAMLSCNRQGQVTFLNSRASSLMGLPGGVAARGTNVLTHLPFVEAGISGAIRECLDAAKPVTREFTYTDAQAREVSARFQIVVTWDEGGRITGAQVYAEDTKAFRRANELLLRAERLKAVGKLTGGVTNAFNSLLQMVAQGARLALDALNRGEHDQIGPLLTEVVASTRHSAQTLRRLRHYARVESDTGVLRWKVFCLSEAVRDAIRISKIDARSQSGAEHAVTLKTSLVDACFIEGDKADITELAVNLLKNAEEALPEGGTIGVSTTVEAGQATLRVRDSGTGIPKQHAEQMFEPFWTSKESHAGLGLAVSVGVVRAHGGRISVKTRKGSGSTFTVLLPSVRPPLQAEEPSAAPRLRGLTFSILLIDDDAAFLQSMEEGLELMGQRVLVARTGEEALEIFEENEIDAVVCDLVMEGMTGWDVSKAVQAICVEKGTPKPPFILLTSYARQLSQNEIFSYPGVNRILEKPIAFAKLIEIIREEVQEGTFVGHKLDLTFR